MDKQAVGDSVDIAFNIVNGFIRLVGALIPITILVLLPLWLLLRWSLSRIKWTRKQAVVQSPIVAEQPVSVTD